MSVVHDTVEGLADARSLVYHLEPCWYPSATLSLESY